MDSEVNSQAVNMVPEAREDGEVPSSRWSSLRRSLRTRRRQIAFAVVGFVALPYALIVLYLIEFIHPVSTLMLRDLVLLRGYDRQWVEFDNIAPVLVQSVMMSEDGQFCVHDGVDWGQMRGVVEDALDGESTRGPAPFRCRRSRTSTFGTAAPSCARAWNCRWRSPPISSGASGG